MAITESSNITAKNNVLFFALVAESVDALDLKSNWDNTQCRFKSGPGHHLRPVSQRDGFFHTLSRTFTTHFYAFFKKLELRFTCSILPLQNRQHPSPYGSISSCLRSQTRSWPRTQFKTCLATRWVFFNIFIY